MTSLWCPHSLQNISSNISSFALALMYPVIVSKLCHSRLTCHNPSVHPSLCIILSGCPALCHKPNTATDTGSRKTARLLRSIRRILCRNCLRIFLPLMVGKTDIFLGQMPEMVYARP